MQCPFDVEQIDLNFYDTGFLPFVEGPSKDNVDVTDALFGSDRSLTLCDGDKIVLKTKCPEFQNSAAFIPYLRLEVKGVQSVTITYLDDEGAKILKYTERVSECYL